MSKRDLGTTSELFDPAGLIETSRREAQAEDASVLDTPALHALCSALAACSHQLHFIGRRRAQRMLVETLVKRLRVESYLEKEPAIRQIRLAKPIFLVAPFRTGTTFLHRLLARDPAHRTPRLWETLQAPPAEPEFRGDPLYFELDYRVAIAKRYLEARERFTPELATIHPSGVDMPEECFGLLETSLLSHSYVFYAPVTEYLAWLDDRSDEEWRACYALYADQLRLLQWWWPGERWVLKTPFHMWAVDALCETFPDALVVQQHRDPAKCVASYCSLMAAAFGPIMSRVDREQIGRIAIRYLRDALARNVAARRAMPPKFFLDIDYRELITDPMSCVRRVYEAVDVVLEPEAERRMLAYISEQAEAHGKGKKHEYTLELYAVDPDEVGQAFREYAALSAKA